MNWREFCDQWLGQWLILCRGQAKIRERMEAAKMASVAIVEAALRLDAKQFSKGIEQAKTEVQKLAGDSRAIGAAAGAGLLAISASAGALALNLKVAADEADGIADSLAGAFKDSPEQLDAVTKKVLELGALGIFTEDQFGGAAQRLQNFGKDAEANLQRIADITAKTGASFDAVGESLARFGRDDKATKQLLKITGIKVGDLVNLGAVLDSTGKALDITGKNGELAVQALEKLVDRDFSGAFLAGTDGASRFSAELKLLKQELGAGIVTVFEEIGDKGAGVLKFSGLLRRGQGLRGAGPAVHRRRRWSGSNRTCRWACRHLSCRERDRSRRTGCRDRNPGRRRRNRWCRTGYHRGNPLRIRRRRPSGNRCSGRPS